MTRREVVARALAHERPPYVPWHFSFTAEAAELLAGHLGNADLDLAVGNHLCTLGDGIGFFEPLGADRWRDFFGVVWDRSVDRDIGIVVERPLAEPTLAGYRWPDPLDPRFFADIPARLARYGDRYRVFQLGFSLYERAWTMRGMEELLTDFALQPEFVDELLSAITEWNLAQVERALTYDIDAVYFGDDWGAQRGLQMSPAMWRRFILPHLRRLYGRVRDAGRAVFIHSCGAVDELFDNLVEAGVTCFNPFQPEVMDVHALLARYRGRLAFHGGLSTQHTLPHGTPAQVEAEAQRLLAAGAAGGYILSPAHAVEGDVPLVNLLASLEAVWRQPGYEPSSSP